MKKCIIITGTSSGIGRECAEYLSSKYIVYGLSRTKIKSVNFQQVECDITNRQLVQKIIAEIYEKERHIDVLINNAGIGISGSFAYSNYEDIQRQLDVNLYGVIHTTQCCLPYLKKSCGKIINISSLAAVFPIPFQSFYSLSKSAVLSLSESLKNELRPFHIQVSCLLLGDIKTGFTQHRIKNKNEGEEYQLRVEKSISKMEKDEQNGQNPKIIAKSVQKLIVKKKISLRKVIGFKNKVLYFLCKILPTKLVNYILYCMYGK